MIYSGRTTYNQYADNRKYYEALDDLIFQVNLKKKEKS